MKRRAFVVALLVGAAFGMGIIVAALTGHLSAPERWEYSEMAQHALQGQGMSHDYLGTPYFFYGSAVYPIVLSAVLWITGGHEVVMVVVQALVFALTAFTIYRIAERLAGKTTALLAAFLAALHPGNLVYIGKLHAQTFDVWLMALSFLLLLTITIADQPIRTLNTIGIGVVLGAAALSRGTVIPFCACWAAWWLWQRRASANAMRAVALVALGGLLTIAPILIQGYQRYGRLIPLRTDTGANLWYGNHPGATGTSYTTTAGSEPVPVIAQVPPVLAGQLVGKTEVEQNRVLTEAAFNFIRHEPVAAFRLFLKKLFFFWWRSPQTGLLYPSAWTSAYQAYYAVVLLLAIVGLFTCLRSNQFVAAAGGILFVLLAVSASVIQALFYVEGRHRWQLEPLLLIFTAVGLSRCLKAVRRC